MTGTDELHPRHPIDVVGQLQAPDLGLSCRSIASVLGELEGYRPECWRTSRTPVVRVLTADPRLAGMDAPPNAVDA